MVRGDLAVLSLLVGGVQVDYCSEVMWTPVLWSCICKYNYTTHLV